MKKIYAKPELEAVEFEYHTDEASTTYGALVKIPDSSTIILFTSDVSAEALSNVLDNSTIKVVKK